MKVEHGDIRDVKIELDVNELEKLAQNGEYQFFKPDLEVGVLRFVYKPSFYLCGELSLDDKGKSYFFLTQDKEENYWGFGEQFQVLNGDRQRRIPHELTGCGEKVIGEIIDNDGPKSILSKGILSYYLDYDKVINVNEKTKEVIEREESVFSEVGNYAVKSKQLVPIVRNALLHSFEKAYKRSRYSVREYAEEIFKQINQIEVQSRQLFPCYDPEMHIFPETNYEISDFIDGLKKQFVDFSINKLVLSGDRMDGEIFDRINNLAKQD